MNNFPRCINVNQSGLGYWLVFTRYYVIPQIFRKKINLKAARNKKQRPPMKHE